MWCDAAFRCCTGTVDDDVRTEDKLVNTAWGCLAHPRDYKWKGWIFNGWFLGITFVSAGLLVAFLVETFLPIFAPVGGVLLLVLTTWLMFMGSRMHAKANAYLWSETVGPLLMRLNIGYALGVLFMMMRRREDLKEIDDDNRWVWILAGAVAGLGMALVLLATCTENGCFYPCEKWDWGNCWAACFLCARDREGLYKESEGETSSTGQLVRVVVSTAEGSDRRGGNSGRQYSSLRRGSGSAPQLTLSLGQDQLQRLQHPQQPQLQPARREEAALAGSSSNSSSSRTSP